MACAFRPTFKSVMMGRSELSGQVLQLKALGIDNVMRFDWLAPPPAEAMVKALESLHALGALDEDAK
jgi:ATP-dependent RNA helicase DDX35